MKPLKILIGNNTLSLLAGSETWVYTLAVQLKAMGHHVACFSPDLGIIAQKLIDQGIQCYDTVSPSGVVPFSFVLEEPIDHDYDVIIANHFHIVEYLRSQYPTKPIISTIHGIIHYMENKEWAPEHPAIESGVNQFVSVSEEVQELLQKEYNIESAIIRNFFDIKKFGALKPPNEKPKQFLINTNYADRDDPAITVVREAAKHFGAKVAAIGMNFSQSFDISKAIEDSDVVFGMGRSVLEGVAAGRLGIVHGRWGTGGPIIESNLENVRRYNFSGRNAKDNSLITTEELIKTIEQFYQPQFLQWGKEYIAREHNAVFAAEQYVQIARELLGHNIIRHSQDGVDPLARPFKLAKNA